MRHVNFLVWVMMGIAVWHFAVFVPDRFWGGIVGAFGAAAIGAVVVGLILAGGEIDDPSLVTALEAIPGALIGLAASWFSARAAKKPTPDAFSRCSASRRYTGLRGWGVSSDACCGGAGVAPAAVESIENQVGKGV